MDKNIIMLLKSISAQSQKKVVTKETKEDYIKIYKRLKAEKFKSYFSGSKNYFYKKKAAVYFCIIHECKICLKRLLSNEYSRKEKEKYIRIAKKLIELHDRYCNGFEVNHVFATRIKKTKKHSIRRMHTNWRDMIWAACENPDYKGPLAILYLTGARPSEIAQGVLVEWEEGAPTMNITIKGTKTGQKGKNGQEKRTITIDLSKDCFRGSVKDYLINQSFEEGYCMIKVHPKRLNDYVRRLSQELWPRKKNHITPYSFRHQFAADLKGEGRGNKEIAELLGHRSTLSQRSYGLARQARGKSSVAGVTCSAKVRVYKKKYGGPDKNGGPKSS
jgi:integrase